MKPLLMIVLAVLLSCNSQPTGRQPENETARPDKEIATSPSGKGQKWQADDATKKNVAAMTEILADTTYADGTKKSLLYASLKERVDTLIKQCSMKGAAHDVLHVWLEKVLMDLKQLNEEDARYPDVFTALKKDVAGFYQQFD